MKGDSRTTAMGLWTDAKDMLAAAKLLQQNESQIILHPLYYLLGHGLEEVLKAFVRAKGATLPCLKSMGHDLELARDWANTSGLAEYYTLSKEDNQALQMLNPYYKSKEFEYRVTGHKSCPETEFLIGLLERILNAIRDVCVKSVTL